MQDNRVLCEMEELLRARDRELREVLRAMIPRGPEYDALFAFLIATDSDLRMLRGKQVDA
jgi:hypothetical protein